MKKSFFLLPALAAFFLSDDIQAQGIAVSSSAGVRPAAFETYNIAFDGHSGILKANYKNNKQSLESIAGKIEENRREIESGQYRIRVASNVAPDGLTPAQAKAEARKRALVLKSYLIKTADAKESYFVTGTTADGNISDSDFLTVGLVPAENQNDGTAVTKE